VICVNERIQFIDITAGSKSEPAARALVVPSAAPTTAADLAAAIEEIRPEGGDVVVVAADHSVTSQLTRLATVLVQHQEQAAQLIDAMFVPGNTVSPAMALQAQRNAEARQELIDEFGISASGQVAELAGSAASNRSATASRWMAAGKIFMVNHLGNRFYPSFQFGTDGQPRPVIASVLDVLRPLGLDGWETALWFTTASGWLDDQRPVDLLAREPEQVVEAARHLVDETVI
jgi:hypothetical protein